MPDALTGRMLFLVGAPRSGTNWLQRMLAAHPDVVALPSETHLFSHGLRHLDTQVQHGLLTSPATGMVYLPRTEWVAAMRAFCVLVYGRVADSLDPSAALIVERSPHHGLHLALIGEVFPDAAVVHIIRDGRDVARSLAHREWGPDGVAAAAEQWRDSVRAARAAAPLLSRYYEVRYEDLMSAPRAQVAALFERLGLAAPPAVLDAVEAEAGVSFNVDTSNAQIGVGKWRTEWDADQLAAFMSVAAATLSDAGYAEIALQPGDRKVRRPRLPRRARRPGPATSTPAHAPVVTSTQAAQMLVDRFVAAAADGTLLSELTDDVDVHYAGPDGGWIGQGPDGAHRLAAVLAAEGRWGRQRRSMEQMVGRTVVVTVTHDASDGSRVDRVLVLGLSPDARLAHVGYTRFPVAVAGEEQR
jgi:hypothetical protein